MTPHQILIVGIRLLAIFWLLGVLGQIPVAVSTFQQMGVSSSPVWASVGIQLAIGVFLWLFPATLASKLLRGGASPVIASNVPFTEWRDLCFVGMGIFVLVRAIPDLIYWLVLWSAAPPLSPDFTFEQKVSAVVTFVELAIGLALLFDATGFASLIQRLRHVGLSSDRKGAAP